MLPCTSLLIAAILALHVPLIAQSSADIEGVAAKIATGTSNGLALEVVDFYTKTQRDSLAALGWLLFAARAGVPDAQMLLASDGKSLFDEAVEAIPKPLRQKTQLLLVGGFEPETARAMGNTMCVDEKATVRSLGWFLLGIVLGDGDSMKMVDQYYEHHQSRVRSALSR